jgi:hypothetical protein
VISIAGNVVAAEFSLIITDVVVGVVFVGNGRVFR